MKNQPHESADLTIHHAAGEAGASAALKNDHRLALDPHDYVSPGLDVIKLDDAFPDMIVGDTSVVDWPFLRKWVEHNWYTDRTSATTGFANRDEASLLYNNAKLFAGCQSLEIGCWRGWSAAHIAKATGALDVVDPLLSDDVIAAKVRKSLRRAGVLDCIALHAGASPAAVDAIATASGRRWSFFFIDGNHDGDAPLRDAKVALHHATSTAMVLFHDLTSPHVAAGLRTLRDAGWRTRLYMTTQIMAVAWRGNVEPVHHIPDPNIIWTLPGHLSGYEVSGWTEPHSRADTEWWSGMTPADRLRSALGRAQRNEDALRQADAKFAASQQEIANRDDEVVAAHAEVIGLKAQLETVRQRADDEAAAADLLAAERDAALARSAAAEMNQARLANAFADLGATLPDTLALEADRRALLDMLDRANQELESLHAVAACNDGLLAECNDLLWRSEKAEGKLGVMQLTRAMQEARVEELRQANKTIVELAEHDLRDHAGLYALASWSTQKRIILGLLRRPGVTRVALFRSRAVHCNVDVILTDAAIHWACRRRTLFGLLRRSSGFAALLVLQTLTRDAEHARRRRIAAVAGAARALPDHSGS